MTRYKEHNNRRDSLVSPVKDEIAVIITGGTIDSRFYELKENGKPPIPVPMRDDSIIPALLRRLFGRQGAERYHCDQWRMKDSNYLTTQELFQLAEKIRQLPQERVLVTHGTDAMARNARFLKEQLVGSGKTVVMTGAMHPIANRRTATGSDGLENLRFALETLNDPNLAPDVHVVGRARINDEPRQYGPGLFKPEELVKDKGELIFKSDPKGIYSGAQL